MAKIVNLPLTDETVSDLKAGDRVLLNGIMYTGRDAAHKRIAELINKNEQLPMDIKNQTIYYVGPCPASRTGNWLSRTHNKRKDGCLCPSLDGPRS